MTKYHTLTTFLCLQLAGFATSCSQGQPEQSNAEANGFLGVLDNTFEVNKLRVIEPTYNPTEKVKVMFEYANKGNTVWCQRSDFDARNLVVPCYSSLEKFRATNPGSPGTKLVCDDANADVSCLVVEYFNAG
jgi:hypothetical protein